MLVNLLELIWAKINEVILAQMEGNIFGGARLRPTRVRSQLPIALQMQLVHEGLDQGKVTPEVSVLTGHEES